MRLQVAGKDQDTDKALIEAIKALTAALAVDPTASVSFDAENPAQAFVFDAATTTLKPISKVSAPDLALLSGIERSKNALIANSRRFAAGFSANNALLWGARGMGKSTLVKSVHNCLVVELGAKAPSLVEIHREDIAALPALLTVLGAASRRFILFCDDLSFSRADQDFKALKSVLEGGLEGRPENVIFYATSNRRHLLPRSAADQEQATGLHASEAMDETIALSDRFGLWLGFHAASQADYLQIIEGYMQKFVLIPDFDWQHDALEWSKTRGNRSGRTAWQYICNLAGTLGQKVQF